MTLITRPRRFGKTLTMSMLEKFFSLDYAGRVGVRKTGTTLIRVSTVMGTLYLGVSGVFGGVLVFGGGAEDSCGEF